MAQLLTVRLTRGDAQPWGFRLQGGKDFGTPVLVQKVNSGSLADQVGLVAGDAVIKINGTEVFELRHKDAQDVVVRAGNNCELTVQRGGSTWKPNVTPLGQLPSHNQYGGISPVTKTSLAHRTPDGRPISAIGTGYNNSARPFGGIYSDESIAETLSAQAEVLAGGVLGVNFKKNEKMYNSANSEVFKMLQEQSNEPDEPADSIDHSVAHHPQQLRPLPHVVPQHTPHHAPQHHVSAPHHAPQHHVSAPHQAPQHHVSAPHVSQQHVQQQQQQQHHHQQQQQYQQSSVTKHVTAPETRPIAPSAGLPPGQNICAECERLIVGVFVRIKDKNLHAECFRCATCGVSLKNQGYFNIHNKLYCDVHAKMAALAHPPSGVVGMRPVPINTEHKIGAGAISAALNARVASNVNGTPQLISNNINNSYVAPKPYNFSQPPSAGPKSPSSYPPSNPTWAQPKPASNYGSNYGSNTLPRQNGGQFNTFGKSNQGSSKGGTFGSTSAPIRGRGTINKAVGPGGRVPLCGCCHTQIRGPFITALGRIWCPDHFICTTPNCRRALQDIGFVEEKGQLYCEFCFEQYFAPSCSKCKNKIKGDCLNAIGKHYHPQCFTCTYCGKLFGNGAFFLEEGEPYCEADWNELFTTKCFACGFPVEAGDRWVEALNNNYHSQCFNCSMCKKNLEGQSFFAKGGRPFCKNHAR